MKRIATACAAAALMCATGAVFAQRYPNQAVRLVVPFAPVGSTDVLGRLVAQRLSKGGRMYVEWPSPHSRLLPKLAEIQAHGYPISTLNFYDDAAHQSTYSIDWMLKHTQRLGFRCEQRGELSLPFLAEQLRDHGVRSKDSFLLSSALWLRTRYVSFASFEKIV